jgi:hypothetical protein
MDAAFKREVDLIIRVGRSRQARRGRRGRFDAIGMTEVVSAKQSPR